MAKEKIKSIHEQDGFGEDGATTSSVDSVQPIQSTIPNTHTPIQVRGSLNRRHTDALKVSQHQQDIGGTLAKLTNEFLENNKEGNELYKYIKVHCISSSVNVIPDDTLRNQYFNMDNAIARSEFIKTHGKPATLEYTTLLATLVYNNVAYIMPLLLEGYSLTNREILTGHRWVDNLTKEEEKARTNYNPLKPMSTIIANVPANHLPAQTKNRYSDMIISTYIMDRVTVSNIKIAPYCTIPKNATDGLTTDMDAIPSHIYTLFIKTIDGLASMNNKDAGIYGMSLAAYKDVTLACNFDNITSSEENIFNQTTIFDGSMVISERSSTSNGAIEYNTGAENINIIVGRLLTAPSLTQMNINNELTTRVRPDIILRNIETADSGSNSDVLLMIYMTLFALNDDQKVNDLYSCKPLMAKRDVGNLNTVCKIGDNEGNLIDMNVTSNEITRGDANMLLNMLFSYPAHNQVNQVGQMIPIPEKRLKPSLVLEVKEGDSMTARIMAPWLQLISDDVNVNRAGLEDIVKSLEALTYTDDVNYTQPPITLSRDDVMTGYTIHPVGYAVTQTGTVIDLAEVSASYLLGEGFTKEAEEWYVNETSFVYNLMDIKMRIINTVFKNVVVFDRAIRIYLNSPFLTLLNTRINEFSNNRGLSIIPPIQSVAVTTGNYNMSNLPPVIGSSIPNISNPTMQGHHGIQGTNGMNNSGVGYTPYNTTTYI